MNDPLRRTPLYATHRAHHARLVPFAGWELPVQYEGIVAEHRAVRETAGLFDASHMGELWLRGKDAAAVADGLVTNAVGRLPVGRALYTCCCSDAGTILDDLIVYHVAENSLLIVCNAGNRDKIAPHVRAAAEGRCAFTDESDETVLLALQGPRAASVLVALHAPEALTQLPRFGVMGGQLQGLDVLVARTGYTGEDGFELFVRAEDGPALWQALVTADAGFRVQPAGLGARDTLRLEAALRLYGNDIDETTDPWEAGLGWTVKLEGRTFVGKSALVARKQRGLSRQLVGLEMCERGIARHGYPVHDLAGQPVGQVTSGGPAPSLGKNIALAYVPPAQAQIGSQLQVEIRGKGTRAQVVPLPFYKRQP